MEVKLTRTLNEGRGLVEGAVFDWDRLLVRKMREDYGDDILVPTGQAHQAIQRMQARVLSRGQSKPTRQERLLGMSASAVHDDEEPRRRRGRPTRAEIEAAQAGAIQAAEPLAAA